MSPRAFRIAAPSRLHFGLLAWGDKAPRQFGSVGLMIAGPGLIIDASPSDRWAADGPLADRAASLLQHYADILGRDGIEVSPIRVTIRQAPPEHVGLGTGTGLSLAVARLLLLGRGEAEPSTPRLVALSGRGRRSGIGLHGSALGGLIVDGGRSPSSAFPPLLARLDFPADWSALVVIPPTPPGLAGDREVEAFTNLPGVTPAEIDRLCRVVLLELLPAVAERDLPAFGSALSDLQRQIGLRFASIQGGLYAHSQLVAIVEEMRRLGLVGVGQSSWGPALFGFSRHDPDQEAAILATLRERFGLDARAAFWTTASGQGSRIEPIESSR